jgi:hypothetical protein
MKKQSTPPRETFETVFPELRMAWLRKQMVATAATEKPFDDRDWINTLRSRAWEAYQVGTEDGVRLAHRLILEASRTALAEICPDQTGSDHTNAPLHDLQWALADLETGHRRKSLRAPPHMKRAAHCHLQVPIWSSRQFASKRRAFCARRVRAS